MNSIVELSISSENFNISNLYLEKVNNILIANYKMCFEFLNCIFNSNMCNIFIGNKRIDNKNTYIINLLDYESIANQLQLKKGTLLYEYIYEEINEKVSDSNIEEDIELSLYNLINESLKDQTIDYAIDLNLDITKVINSFLSIKMDLSIYNYISVIKKLIYNLKQKNIRKNILLLLNTKIFNNELDDIENILILKFYSNVIPNIIIHNSIVNIDLDILINQIRLNYPTDIDDKMISNHIKLFCNDILHNEIIISDYKIYISYIIIMKILNINFKIIPQININEIPNEYKEYLKYCKTNLDLI